jgi:hypothetical protein
MAELKPFVNKPLFNYVKITPPVVNDIKSKARKSEILSAVLKKTASEQKEWANEFLKSGKAVKSKEQLQYPYFNHLKLENIPGERLPKADHIRDKEQFPGKTVLDVKEYQLDYENSLLTLAAYKILGQADEANNANRIFSFVELFPALSKTHQRMPYRPVIFSQKKKVAAARDERLKEKDSERETHESGEEESHEPRLSISKADMKKAMGAFEKKDPKDEAEELDKLAEDLSFFWKLRHEIINQGRKEYQENRKQILEKQIDRPVIPIKKKNGKKEKEILSAFRKEHAELIKTKKYSLAAAKDNYEKKYVASRLGNLLGTDENELAKYNLGLTAVEIKNLKDNIKDLLDHHKIPIGKFCETYEKVVEKKDKMKYSVAATAVTSDCFGKNPMMDFQDTVRVLGRADLIKVEERFIKYTPGEISYIENVLPGEERRRKVKNKNYFEQQSESITEEITDTSKEASSSSKQELSNQVESEINTRLNSDINSTISASGGGTLGVVDIEGAGSVDVGLDAALDTSLSTSDKSEFSQEIINKAIEKVKKTTMERRVSRSYSLFETLNFHKIDNSGQANPINGIYCFLDKHICITESVYGNRLYLMANVLLPGKSLLCEKKAKLDMGLAELGEKPIFDITPADINPSNYRELTGRFKAAGVKPPPSPVLTIGKTYKTDTTNANVEQKELKIKNVADVLVPFFEQYKRYLVTDNIALPDGYEVQEVLVTVNHGSNGISIPAHLPLKLMGAALYASPLLIAGALFPPYFMYGLWTTAYMASPFLHYNTDSSNVTVCVGNESYDSAYYFFEPEFLLREILQMINNFSSLAPSVIKAIGESADEMIKKLNKKAGDIPENVKDAVTSIIKTIKSIFDSIINADLTAAGDKLVNFTKDVVSIKGFNEAMDKFFKPLQDFIHEVLDSVGSEVQQALEDLFDYLHSMFENNQTIPFFGASGFRDELPVSFNTVAIKPGITINLTACLRRTEEGLDKWRLETFQNLYQGYLQILADYESRAFLATNVERIAKSPGTMRNEERLAIKELVMYALNNLHQNPGNNYTLEKMNLFENAIDWKNMAYKLYNYGPNMNEILLDKMGAYIATDERRRAFLKSLWAQVLIPLQPIEQLEKQVGLYIDTGSFDLESEFTDEALTVLYRDLILERELLNEQPRQTSRHTVIPTDFVMLRDTLPVNDDTPCTAP